MSANEEKGDGILYQTRVLAYVDVLGWRELIKNSVHDPSVMNVVSRAVQSLTSAQTALARVKAKAAGTWKKDMFPEVTVFSDTIVASCVMDELAIEVLVGQVQMFCVTLMQSGLYTRGAIVRGHLHHRDGVIIGPALVDAYLLENKIAKYPRVVVSEELCPGTLASLYPGAGPVTASATLKAPAIVDDLDGLRVLNPFDGSLVPPGREFIEPSLARVQSDFVKHYGDVAIRSKLGWLQKFLVRLRDQPATAPATAATTK